jgi:GT2 family glycosyltransferase
MSDLSVITVTHQSALFIEDQVFSVVSGAMKTAVEQIVVDNASTDGTQGVLKGLKGVLAKVVENGENVGFAVANNQGLVSAEGRYVLFLNPDMRVQEGSLDVLVEWMDAHPKAGICSCLLVDGMGRPLEMGFPRPLPRFWKEVMWLLRLDGLWKEKKKRDWKEVCEVEMVKGAFLLARKELLMRLGFGFDPRYFLMYEDTDLCREIQKMGYGVFFHPGVQCVDYNSRSFSVKTGEWIYGCFSEGMLRYFQKWESWHRGVVIALLIPIGRWLRKREWKYKQESL